MLRKTLLAVALILNGTAGCHHAPQPMTPREGELPPLPPASGTPVGYLLDNAAQLKLDDTQVARLKEIDNSLAARNDGLDTQLREIEQPEGDDDAPAKKGAPPPKPKNMAPGASPVHTTADSNKLHAAKDANNKDALAKAFSVLDPQQQVAARKLLDDRGISSPGAGAKPEPKTEGADGVPLEP